MDNQSFAQIKPFLESRVISTYMELPNHKKGCLFYVSHLNCVCLLDTPYRKGDTIEIAPQMHISELKATLDTSTHLAHGLPAILWDIDSYSPQIVDILLRYYFSEYKPRFEEVVNDWLFFLEHYYTYFKEKSPFKTEDTLHQIASVVKKVFPESQRSVNLENIFDPYHIRTIIDGFKQVQYLTFVSDTTLEQGGFCVYLLLNTLADLKIALEQNVWAAFGISAVLVNIAVSRWHVNQWRSLAFTNVEAVKKYFDEQMYMQERITPLADLNFNFTFDYKAIFQTYLDKIVPRIKKYMQSNPDFPLEMSEDRYIYSYIYGSEKLAYQVFQAKPLYLSFSATQRDKLNMFFKRYLEYLKTQYGADEELFKAICRKEYGFSEPLSISFAIKTQITDKDGNDVTLERMRQSGWDMPKNTKEADKFRYIKSTDPNQIEEIEAAMFIYIDSNNPSELCRYVYQHRDTHFLPLPATPHPFYSAIEDRWGDKNKIKASGLKMAWLRNIKHSC